MALTKTTFILVIVTIIGGVVAGELPDFLHICKVGDPQYETCIIKSLEVLRPYIKVGIPEYNIPPLEPLVLERLSADSLKTLRLQMYNVTIYGGSNFHVTKLKADSNKLFYTVSLDFPYIFVNGKYNVEGKLLLLPIHGSGPVRGNFSNSIGSANIQAEKYIQNGVEKIRIRDLTLKIVIKKGLVQLDNLFNGDKVLGNVINSAINNNFEIFANEILPFIQDALCRMLQDIGNKIVSHFTYAQLFPKA